jgi:hypothetical protein
MLHWTRPADLVSLSISRSPGRNGAAETVVDRGGSGTFTDTQVRNGVRYTYTITARDQAGNVSVRTLGATPGLRLLGPSSGAKLTGPPVLRWTAALGATYYNVQLYRGRRKVLSVWPSSARLRLTSSWSFRRHVYRLRPGRYRWYVWPGYGSRRAAHYGQLIGVGTFSVT